jgi:hypothetical protein
VSTPALCSRSLSRETRMDRSSKAAQILKALSTGPKTNRELNEIAFRYSARIHELRKAGHNIQIISEYRDTGLVVYALMPSEVAA